MQENVQVSKGEVSPSLQYLSLRRRSPSKLSLLRSVRVFPLPPLREPPQRPTLRIAGAAKPFRSELSERRNEVRIARNPNEHDNESARKKPDRRRRERPKLSTFSFPFSTQNAASPCSQASHHPTQSQLP